MAMTTMPPGAPPGVPSSNPSTTDTTTTTDDERRAVDRKLATVRARMFARIDELGRRVGKARNALDLARIVRDHPFTAIGLAAGAGAIAGFGGGRGPARGRIGALVMGVAMQAARTAITGWVLDQIGPAGANR